MAMQDGKSQADTREFMVYVDQHGREWEGFGDIKAKLHPCGKPLKQVFGVDEETGRLKGTAVCAAPWLPDQTAFRFNTRNPSTFVIDYDSLLAQSDEAHAARYNHVLAVADHFNVPNFDPATSAPTAQMKREMGDGPHPSDPILACMATPPNGFILGLRAFDPENPKDVKLTAALAAMRRAPKALNRGAEYADEFAEDEVEVVTPKGRKTLAAAGG